MLKSIHDFNIVFPKRKLERTEPKRVSIEKQVIPIEVDIHFTGYDFILV